ncbi:hypothetical protein F4778DRAFT_717658 [Xylariomycetidae sp. FL2044]|nr:hypothetical protein F4778DRAFT_717658 [Xylariomycetidae sp. FL2044]
MAGLPAPPPGAVLPGGQTWDWPYPFQLRASLPSPRGNLPLMTTGEISAVEAHLRKTKNVRERPLDSRIPLMLNIFNMYDSINLNTGGTFVYFHKIEILPPAGAAPPPINFPAEILADMTTMWASLLQYNYRGPIGIRLARYRFYVFIHVHNPGPTSAQCYSMSVWDRELNFMQWCDTRWVTQGSTLDTRWAEVVNYWQTVALPPGVVLPPNIAAAVGGNIAHFNNAGAITGLDNAHHVEWNGRHHTALPHRSLFQMIAIAMELVDDQRFQVAFNPGRDAFDDASGLGRPTLPRLFVFLLTLLYANRASHPVRLNYLTMAAQITNNYGIVQNEMWKDHLRFTLFMLLGIPNFTMANNGFDPWIVPALGL